MKVFRQIINIKKPTAVVLGYFNSIHLRHKEIIFSIIKSGFCLFFKILYIKLILHAYYKIYLERILKTNDMY